MTREEALNELVERYNCTESVDGDYIDCISIEAIEIAIACLEHELKNEKTCITCQGCGFWDTCKGKKRYS
jgi:hypothetical protein